MGRSPLALPPGAQPDLPIEAMVALRCQAALEFMAPLARMLETIEASKAALPEETELLVKLRDRMRAVTDEVLSAHAKAILIQRGKILGRLLEIENDALAGARALAEELAKGASP
jgi:hypothetical protein